MSEKNVKRYLDKEGVPYVSMVHPTVFTAQETAQSTHVSGKALAKTVIVKLDGKMAMAAIPADEKLDLIALRETSGSLSCVLANEEEFKTFFPECEVGAMPPIGSMYGIKTYVSEKLSKQKEIVFNAGTHTEALCLKYEDFEKVRGLKWGL